MCNTSAKRVIPVQLHIEILDYDWLINNTVFERTNQNLLFSNQARALDGAIL